MAYPSPEEAQQICRSLTSYNPRRIITFTTKYCVVTTSGYLISIMDGIRSYCPCLLTRSLPYTATKLAA